MRKAAAIQAAMQMSMQRGEQEHDAPGESGGVGSLRKGGDSCDGGSGAACRFEWRIIFSLSVLSGVFSKGALRLRLFM